MMRWWLDRGRRRLPDGRHQPDLQADLGCPTATRSLQRARPADPRVPAGDAPRGVRRARRAADRRRDAGRDASRRRGCSPTRRAREVDMVFQFEHVQLDQGPTSKWDIHPLRLRDLKASLGRWQDGPGRRRLELACTGTTTTSRARSRASATTASTACAAAKMLGTVLHLHRGTPYVYQGEELGMTNAPFGDDRGLPRHRVAEPLRRGGRGRRVTRRRAARAAHDGPRQRPHADAVGRRARTPASRPASRGSPVNPNHTEINAEAERADPDSVFHHYRRLIELRHALPVIADGDFTMLLAGRRARLRVHARAGRRRAARARQLHRRRGRRRRCPGWEDAERAHRGAGAGARAVGGEGATALAARTW